MSCPSALIFWIDSSSPPFGPVVGAPRLNQSDHSQNIVPGQVGVTGLVLVSVVVGGIVVVVVVLVVGVVVTGVIVGVTGVGEVVEKGVVSCVEVCIVVGQFTFLQHFTFIS